MTELATTQRTTVDFTQPQVELIKRTICKPRNREATNDELALFVGQAKRTGLDPFSRQIYAVFRWDGQLRDEKMTIQASIDGLRLVAERSGHYLGQLGPFWCDERTEWTDVWFKPTPPQAAKVIVRKLIHGQVAETPAVAHWGEYVATNKDGSVSRMWSEKAALMLAKCAEALALRKAFPNDMSGLYTSEEMGRADVTAPLLGSTSDIPSDFPGPQDAPLAPVTEPEEVTGDVVPEPSTIDPAFACDLFDVCAAKLTTVGQFRGMLEGVGAVLPQDLRTKEARLAVLSGLSLKQGMELERALRVLPGPRAAS